MYPTFRYIFLSVIILQQLSITAQTSNRRPLTYFQDFNIRTLRAENPIYQMPVDSGRKFIVSDNSGKKRATIIKFVEIRGKYLTPYRTAKMFRFQYGTVIAFKVLVSGGYEKVGIFGDRDYTRDSLLIANDTLYFKEMDDDQLTLKIVFPSLNDTLKVWYGYRNIRYDFLKKIVVNPPLRDKKYWLTDTPLDHSITYTFIKSGSGYMMQGNENPGDKTNEIRVNYLKQKYMKCNSPFWAALADLSF